MLEICCDVSDKLEDSNPGTAIAKLSDAFAIQRNRLSSKSNILEEAYIKQDGHYQ
jgi:hypothetical protein